MTTTHQFQNLDDARAYALAGNATMTLESLRSGAHYTYRIRQAKDKVSGEPQAGVYFVSLLTEGNADEGTFHYLGMIKDGKFFATKASASRALTPSFKAFQFFFQINQLHPELAIRHEGRCGRCGRTLTVPASIDAGIGPECASKM